MYSNNKIKDNQPECWGIPRWNADCEKMSLTILQLSDITAV